MQSFSFIPLTASEEKIFEYFFKNLPFMLPWQPIKFSEMDKIHMNIRGLLKKYFCKKKYLNICSETAKIVNFHFSHCKSMETISFHSNQSSYPIGTKKHNYSFPPPSICGTWKESAAEEKLSENVDDGRMDDGCPPIL